MPRPKWLVMAAVAVLAFLGMAGFAFSAWRNGQTNAARHRQDQPPDIRPQQRLEQAGTLG